MNTGTGKMSEVSDWLAKKLRVQSTLGDRIWKKGEVVKVEGKVGTFKVHALGKKYVVLKVLPIVEENRIDKTGA